MRKPSILVPYAGAQLDAGIQDIFVMMRPETNGTLGEKAILKTINSCTEYKKKIKLVYLANIPSETIKAKHLLEQYYALKIYFATHDKRAFTIPMQQKFTEYFGVPFEKASIIGAFHALECLNLKSEELFNIWVDKENIANIYGQTIKHYRGYYIVNYDIPALLHRNAKNADIAVMLFRVTVPYKYFVGLTQAMQSALIDDGVVAKNEVQERAFHFSSGPLEQLRDATTFLFLTPDNRVPLSDLSFWRYLADNNIDMKMVEHLLRNPIVLTENSDGTMSEQSLLNVTRYKSYSYTMQVLKTISGMSRIVF